MTTVQRLFLYPGQAAYAILASPGEAAIITRVPIIQTENTRGCAAMEQPQRPLISLMLAVADAPAAVEWYQRALGATVLWSLGSVAGLEIDGAPFFLAEPANNGWETPAKLGMPSARVEVFCDDPDAVIARALAAGATGSMDDLRNHQTPWGIHRQGGFVDPFGHIWFVGDKSPLLPYPR
jgi:PhnB protein